MFALLRAAGTGLIGFITPRVLIAAGVPLDRWALAVGGWLPEAVQPLSSEAAVLLLSCILAVVLVTAELWWHPLGSLISFVKGKPKQQEATSDTATVAIAAFVPLEDAAAQAYEKSPFLAELWEEFVSERGALLSMYAERIAKEIQVYGALSPSNHVQPVLLKNMTIRLRNGRLGAYRGYEPEPRWTNLQVQEKDLPVALASVVELERSYQNEAW